MKRMLVVLIGLLLLSVVSIAKAQDTEPEDNRIFGLVVVNEADIRAGPDFAYPIVGRLPRNASVEIFGRAGDFFQRWDGRQWVQIDYGVRRAWVYARLLRTSIPFNSIPPRGRILPRDGDGRVPEVFDLSVDICSTWVGDFTLSGNFFAGDTELTVTYPELPGANVYSVIVISPTGFRTAFDSTTTTATILLERLPFEEGVYTWRVAPYWTDQPRRSAWQQVCLLQTGGTFDKPDTTPVRNQGD